MVLPDGAPPIRYRYVHVQPDGKLRWGKTTLTRNPPTSDPHTVTYEAADGTKQTLSGFYYPYAEMGGGLMVVPEPLSSVGPIRITIDGLPAGVDRVLNVARPCPTKPQSNHARCVDAKTRSSACPCPSPTRCPITTSPGRDAPCGAPPGQNPACGFPAPGSHLRVSGSTGAVAGSVE